MAVIKIIVAGMKYMLSDVVTNKQEAIGDIRGSLLGLLIVLAAWLVLWTINPQLTDTSVFDDLRASGRITPPTPNSPVTVTPQAPYIPNLPGMSAILYSSTTQARFIADCQAQGGVHEYVLGRNALDVCFSALPANVVTFITDNTPAASHNNVRNFYQRTIIPKQVPVTTQIQNRIENDTQFRFLQPSPIYFYIPTPTPPFDPGRPDWIDQRVEAQAGSVCSAIRLGYTPSSGRDNVHFYRAPDNSYVACLYAPPIN